MSDTIFRIPEGSVESDRAIMLLRRAIVILLNVTSLAALAAAMLRVLAVHGWSIPAIIFMLLFLLALPWTLLGFWNAVIGFAIRLFVRDSAAFVNPALRATPADSAIVARVAVCLAIRHEDVEATFARLEAMVVSMKATDWAAAFAFHVLSDSSQPEVITAEDKAFSSLAARHPEFDSLHYHRRLQNTAFKAGNLREFAESSNSKYDFMIVLDADSFMSAAAMLRLVRVMQENPRLGILQTLVVGRPAESGFARVFQFGMRHAMRVQATGAAWWQGASGPYWGHNAIIRIAPFVEHCALPTLAGGPPLGGPVLSHDQVEAVMMRAAEYDVRVIADEFESWEENPPSLLDFIKRDLRWCQGNMQYIRLLAAPGLKPMGRFQLINALMMYVGAPLSFLMLVAGIAMAFVPDDSARLNFPSDFAFALYIVMMAMAFAPRLVGMFDVLLRPDEARQYGGAARLLAGSLLDVLFSLFLGPVMMVSQALFVIGLIFGRRVIWEAQNRNGREVGIGEAMHGLWPQMLFGVLAIAVFGLVTPGALPWALPTIVPTLAAAPFACVTAGRPFGRLLRRFGLCAVPGGSVAATASDAIVAIAPRSR
jgi:membrane glycosyltransferase